MPEGDSALKALFIPNTPADSEERFGALAAWCPWCEDIHFHGDAGGGAGDREEHRLANCSDASASPFLETGYTLHVSGKSHDAAALLPDCPMTQPYRAGKRNDRARFRLHRLLNANFAKIRSAMLAAITGRSKVSLRYDQVNLPDSSRLNIYVGGEAWDIRRDGEQTSRGDGYISLAATLYGLPSGVAAVRLFEAATATRLDREAIEGLQTVIDGWIARGAKARRGNGL